MNVEKKKGIGFKYAINGIYLMCSQRNFKIHLVVAFLVSIAGFLFKISLIEWTIVFISISGVLALEMLNSAIEMIVDQISPEYSLFAKKTKDIAAGAVLIFSIGAFIVGLIIFIPKFIQILL